MKPAQLQQVTTLIYCLKIGAHYSPAPRSSNAEAINTSHDVQQNETLLQVLYLFTHLFNQQLHFHGRTRYFCIDGL